MSKETMNFNEKIENRISFYWKKFKRGVITKKEFTIKLKKLSNYYRQ